MGDSSFFFLPLLFLQIFEQFFRVNNEQMAERGPNEAKSAIAEQQYELLAHVRFVSSS